MDIGPCPACDAGAAWTSCALARPGAQTTVAIKQAAPSVTCPPEIVFMTMFYSGDKLTLSGVLAPPRTSTSVVSGRYPALAPDLDMVPARRQLDNETFIV